jgi:hypothetical protein
MGLMSKRIKGVLAVKFTLTVWTTTVPSYLERKAHKGPLRLIGGESRRAIPARTGSHAVSATRTRQRSWLLPLATGFASKVAFPPYF